MYNGVMRALQRLGLADIRGNTDVPLYVLNVTYPLIDEEFLDFARDKDAVLVVEEGQPNHIEQAFGAMLHKAGIPTKVLGKDPFPIAGEYTGAVMLESVRGFLRRTAPEVLSDRDRLPNEPPLPATPTLTPAQVPPRPPGFCVGCPERPIFAAMKLVEKELGPHHVAADIGCHLFSILPPFNIGASTMGRAGTGVGLRLQCASEEAADLGDGRRWLLAQRAEQQHRQRRLQQARWRHDYCRQFLLGCDGRTGHHVVARDEQIAADRQHDHQGGARCRREVGAPDRSNLRRALDARHAREALTSKDKGPKIIVASSECMLNKQRREKPLAARTIADGKRVVKPRFGVDEDVCTGDHACIRLSGCPSLSVKVLDDPLRDDPVAAIDETCVGCGNCGEVADAAVLCPSFYRADVIHNPSPLDRRLAKLRAKVTGWLQQRRDRKRLVFGMGSVGLIKGFLQPSAFFGDLLPRRSSGMRKDVWMATFLTSEVSRKGASKHAERCSSLL